VGHVKKITRDQLSLAISKEISPNATKAPNEATRDSRSVEFRPGRDGLLNLVRSTRSTLKYEPGLIVAEGDYVIVHDRFSGTGRPRNWIAADVVRVVDGVLAEHWDVLQDEATEAESRSGLPMFGTTFPE
jgi:hypothetical protein